MSRIGQTPGVHWMDLARRQSGVITRVQLLASGLTEARVQGLVRRAELIRLHRGTYAHRSVRIGPSQRRWAAVLWSGGVLSHRSAAVLWGIEVVSLAHDRPVHVSVSEDRRVRSRPAEVAVHRVDLAASATTTRSGLPVTSRHRTYIDLLRTESDALVILDRAVQLGHLDAASIRQELTKNPGRHGNSALSLLLDKIEPGAHAESERVLHGLLRKARIAGWLPQLRVRTATLVAYLDVGFRAEKVGLEVDGRRHHDAGSHRFESDRIRQNALITEGWLILRFTWQRLTRSPDAVVAEIRAALRSRA